MNSNGEINKLNHVKESNDPPYQLIGYITVVTTRHSLTNGTLHETRKGWKNIDWRINLYAIVNYMKENRPIIHYCILYLPVCCEAVGQHRFVLL